MPAEREVIGVDDIGELVVGPPKAFDPEETTYNKLHARATERLHSLGFCFVFVTKEEHAAVSVDPRWLNLDKRMPDSFRQDPEVTGAFIGVIGDIAFLTAPEDG